MSESKHPKTAAAVGAGVAGGSVATYAIWQDDLIEIVSHYAPDMHPTLIKLLVGGLLGMAIALWPKAWPKISALLGAAYDRILFALKKRPPPSPPTVTLALLLALAPATAGASGARVVLNCAETVDRIEEVPGTDGAADVLTEECADPEWYMDVGLKFDGLVLRLNRPRELIVGFDAGAGYGVRWSPAFWTHTAALLAFDLFVQGGYQARESTDDAVTVSALGVITVINWIGVGVGVRHAFGLGNSSDETVSLGTLGIATSF